MRRQLTNTLIVVGLFIVLALGAGWLLAVVRHERGQLPSATHLLDIAAGVVCLLWLLFILKVPWDLYFETGNVLFEMQRSREQQLAVKPERERYVRRLRRLTGLCALAAHFGSAAIIAALTRWAHGQIGYYFALFYIVTTLFRPASRAYQFLRVKLRDIRNEVKYPRDDVVKLRYELAQLRADLRTLKETDVRTLAESLRHDSRRLTAHEETLAHTRAELSDLHTALEHTERSSQERLHRLSEEVEHALVKAFDNQNIVNGLSAFARLIKQA